MICLAMMKRTSYIKFGFAFVLGTLLWACMPVQNLPKQNNTNYVSLYDPASSNIRPDACFRHMSKDSSFLFFRVNPQNMMSVTKADGSLSDEAYLLLRYAIRDAETKEIVDSASFQYRVSKKTNSDFITYVPFYLPAGKDYYASVLFVDDVKKSWKRLLIDINKSDKQPAEYFFPEYLFPNQKPVFHHFIRKGSDVRISSEYFRTKPLMLLRFENDSSMPLPAYSQRNIPDFNPEFTVDSLLKFNDTINFDRLGFYKIVADTIGELTGFNLLVADEHFPYIRTPETMLPPLQYITNSSQYRIIQNSDSLKYAIDEYWLKLGGSVVKSRELIRIYYNRVQLANQFFTTTKEGWKTDRGMIYVLFGVPKSIYKNYNQEEWLYAESDMNASLIFRFERDENSLSENEFRLVRNERFKQAWNQAIMTWRNGQAYSIR
jgi:GWxTD domain-containing protein